MGQLVFQATLGGAVNLVGPNTASNYNLNVPAAAGTLLYQSGGEANGTLLIGNGAGYSTNTLSNGQGITITNGAGSITIATNTSGTSILKGNGSGGFSNATAGTDYVSPTGTETLTNKTIEAGIFTNGYTEEVATANTGTSYTIDLANGSVQILTLTGNVTFTFPTATAGKGFTMILKQDSFGSRTVNWGSSVKWPSSTNPTITATASRSDKYVFVADGTYWIGSVAGQNYSL